MNRLFVIAWILIASAAIAAAQPATSKPSPSDPCAEIRTRATRAETQLNDWPVLAQNPKYGGFFPGKPYIDRGISSQTTPQMLIRFRPDVIALQPKVVVILAGTNDIAGNTGPMTLQAIEDNLTSMFDLAHANGIRVVFASVLPISDYEKNREGQQIIRSKQRPPEQITALNAWMKTYAAAHRGVYLDYFSAMADDKGFLKEELSEDGLHPNKKGYDIMAPLAEQAITAALKSRR